MIDVKAESPLPIRQTPAVLESITGHRPTMATVYRWLSAGRLDYFKVGHRTFTSHEAIARFVDLSTRSRVARRSGRADGAQ